MLKKNTLLFKLSEDNEALQLQNQDDKIIMIFQEIR